MILSETDLKLLIKEYLLEEKTPKKGTKMYDGEYYESKDGKVRGLIMVYESYQFSYFLLPKGTKLNNAETFTTVLMPGKNQKHLDWSADLDDYDDYSQAKFFEHIKAGRICTGVNFKKQLDKNESPVEEFFYNFGYDAIGAFAGALEILPIPGIQQAATVLSKGMSAGNFVSAIKQNDFMTATFAVIGMVPVVGGAVGSALKTAEKARKAKMLPKPALTELKNAFRKFLQSDVQGTVEDVIEGLTEGSGLSANFVLPKINSSVKNYIKTLEEEESKAV